MRWPWDHRLDLTFQFKCSHDLAFKRIQSFADSITRRAGGPVPWVAVAEPHKIDGYHLHVLIRGTAAIPTSELRQRWERRNGSAVVFVNPDEEKVGYVVKWIAKGTVAWDRSNGFWKAMLKLDRRSSVLRPIPDLLASGLSSDS